MLNVNELWADACQSGAHQSNSPRLVDDLPSDDPNIDGELFIIRNSESRYLTHLFHKYPGKFIPHIPRWALKRFLRRNESAVVLDPFVGSGTTMVEAVLYGQHGIGFDVDPLARLISKVKTTPIPESRLRDLVGDVCEQLDRYHQGSFLPRIPTLSHWFNEQAIADLSAIRDVIETFRSEEDVYDFLLVCFSSIIRRVSNADNQTMKTYVSHTNPKKPEPARKLFREILHTYTDRLSKFSQLAATNVGRSDILDSCAARDLKTAWEINRYPLVDLAITSPPYIKSVDYIYNQMAELFWIGDHWGLENQSKQNAFKRRYIGHDRPSAKDSSKLHRTGIREVDVFIERVFERNTALAYIMWRYFNDMLEHFSSIRAILKPQKHYVIVIGDSTLAGIPIPTHTLLKVCAERHGFRAAVQFAYEIRNKYMHFPRGGNGGIVAHDWVIDLVHES